jgi:hypothetical protein
MDEQGGKGNNVTLALVSGMVAGTKTPLMAKVAV